MNTKESFLILGQGYVGNFLRKFLDEKGAQTFGTHRFEPLEFRLEDPSTWKNIPTCENCFWLFDPTSENLALNFLEQNRAKLGRLTMLGTTSVYEESAGGQISETSPVDLSRQRVLVEKEILAQDGQVVRASGIYGPERNPVKWLLSGRISQLEKWLNLIHVDDLIRMLFLAQNLDKRGQVFIASNNQPIIWRHIAESFGFSPRTSEDFDNVSGSDSPLSLSSKRSASKPQKSRKISSKIINNDWSLATLKHTILHPDVLTSLKQLNESETL